jgi:diaminopimelate decarboxylase/aspartate kinase
MTAGNGAWIVLKFGGTSVSSAANWHNVARVVAERHATGRRVLVVHSALSGVTDLLEKLIAAALDGSQASVLADIGERHRALARDLDVSLPAGVERHLADLTNIAAGIALVGEASDRMRARVMAAGELMATTLGAAFLEARGLPVAWADARTMLLAEGRRGASQRASVLSATCAFAPDEDLDRRLRALSPVIVTQGFIARDEDGGTVLLGRGGSDTSGAYLAAKLRAERLEIWTDVPGMFSANPRTTPTARLLKSLHYDEAQEIATSGAKVLHPRCILPVRQYGIPLGVHDTRHPELPGTTITADGGDGAAQVKAVAVKKGITLVSLDSPGMWHQVGFLADVFQVFKSHGLSVDLVSTSETNVTVSLDPAANTLDADVVETLLADLSVLCRARIIGPCASVSLVGRNIRGILHRLGDAFAVFEEQRIHLVSQAANDLNFTFVVDEDQADRLVEQLHEFLVRPVRADRVLGPTWEQLFGAPQDVERATRPWWQRERAALLEAFGRRAAAFVYHRATVSAAARALRDVRGVDRVLYAMKANPNADLLRVVHAAGLGFECVSRGEIEATLAAVPGLEPGSILYTPNFAPREEYAWALECGVQVTIDNAFVLERWPELFAGQRLFVRIDTGAGRGHHQHVRTAGSYSKFGVPVDELPALARLAAQAGATVVGLHAHAGSGIFDVSSWRHTAEVLGGALALFPDVRVLDLGGGLGVPDRAGRAGVDLAALGEHLVATRSRLPGCAVWLEPGRYLVAEAGVLLARVTQTKSKGEIRYVGVATGINSLIRPALYGAHHDIVNLSRLGMPATESVNVVGPICESGDVLGHDRLLPASEEGDVLLVATAGAYGRAMSSRYNLREPAEELIL